VGIAYWNWYFSPLFRRYDLYTFKSQQKKKGMTCISSLRRFKVAAAGIELTTSGIMVIIELPVTF